MSDRKSIKIGFIGAGSLGSVVGGYLASIKSLKYDIEVVLFCRKAHADVIRNNGLTLEKINSTSNLRNLKAYESEAEFEADRAKQKKSYGFDFLFLTTKTYDIASAMVQYKKEISPSKWLVILQNGVSNEEIVKGWCSEKKIIRVVTTLGALLKAPGVVAYTGPGITKIGFPLIVNGNTNEKEAAQGKRDLKLLSDLLNTAGLETVVAEDIVKECWEKVFINIGINPFGALTRLKNGLLFKIDDMKELMAEAVKEAVAIAKLKKINLSDKDFVAATFDVVNKTSENKNSMLQDILRGRRTEIDFMNGKIAQYARELGIKAPINELLTALIKGTEKSFTTAQ